MGRLQIEDRAHQQEEKSNSKKEEESSLVSPPPPQLGQGNLVKNYQKNGNLSQIIHKIKL